VAGAARADAERLFAIYRLTGLLVG